MLQKLKIKNLTKLSVLLGMLIVSYSLCFAQKNTQDEINLAGLWRFQIDENDAGVTEKWFSKVLADKVFLPGSMLTNNKGKAVTADTKWTGNIWDSIWYKNAAFEKYRKSENTKISFWLQPSKHYVGVAWYQKEVNVTAAFNKESKFLFLERCHWETQVWIDDVFVGTQNALATAHQFDVSKYLTLGKHTITIRIDNSIKKINPGLDAHSISDNTQTNWNGIVGKMAIVQKPSFFVDNVAIFPKAKEKIVKVKVRIVNSSDKAIECELLSSVFKKSLPAALVSKVQFHKIVLERGVNEKELEFLLLASTPMWDEFNPNLLTLKTTLVNRTQKEETFSDFGLRDLKIEGTRFKINDIPIFLRGTLECAIFPKTGFPPTDVASWEKIYKRCKDYGLNHVRFHSWCPPEAAFVAADKLGIFLSIEASAWVDDLGKGDAIDQFVYDESERIVKAYGNHPSFILMLYGNEAHGKEAVPYLSKFLQYWKNKNDNRQKYSSAAGFPESLESQYVSAFKPRIQLWAAGLKSPINSKLPSTDYDWASTITKDRPTISHEIGQWCVYPDFKEIKKYTGPLKAKNFEIFQDFLAENGMKHLADSFLLASGKLQTLCYKADIEAALRTRGFAGFQLLDLHDFTGQGTATVGVVNAFWEDKGYVTGPQFKSFCNTVVPLARMKKMIFENNETFDAEIQVANFSSVAFNANVEWSIKTSNNSIVAKGTFTNQTISVGNELFPGNIKQSLAAVTTPQMLILSLKVDQYKNNWEFFVYPSVKNKIDDAVMTTQTLDSAAIAKLAAGGKVLLTLKKGSVLPEKGGNVQIGFSSIFWNTAWTNKQAPTTLGILCNPKHPAFAAFPTQYHSNFQWWDAMSYSSAIRLDVIDKNLKPIVRVIDDWYTAKPLGLLMECNVGKGKLLISGIDFVVDIEKRTEGKQLLHSILSYMNSNAFAPTASVKVENILALTHTKL